MLEQNDSLKPENYIRQKDRQRKIDIQYVLIWGVKILTQEKKGRMGRWQERDFKKLPTVNSFKHVQF